MTGKKAKVLLTASYGPNELGWGEDMYDINRSRLDRGHGPFGLTSHCHYLGLYLIAENITNPTTVLENPHLDEFERELDEGYDFVGFQLKSLHTPKIARMIRAVKEKSPGTKVVVGGYGVNALKHDLPGDVDGDAEYIRQNADYLCREEGVRFMRRILGDEPVDREITQYHLPFPGASPISLNMKLPNPMLLVSLGCPNACDFCNTSAMFDHKKIYVAEPEQIVRFMKNYQDRLNARNFVVSLYDEDFFLNKDYVYELGRLLRADRKTWGMKYFSFGSVRSLSQFTAEELRDNGLGAVWIGVESFLCGMDLPQDTYAKRRGNDIKRLFDDLHKNGVHITASIVLGFDFHNPENLKDDIDQFVALKPDAYQVSPLLPCPGTALFERFSEEGRIDENYKWEDFHLWSGEQYEPKNFAKGDMKKFHDYAIEKLRDVNGPPMLQAFENALDSHMLLKNEEGDFHAYRARKARGSATAVYPFMKAVEKLHPSEAVRDRAKNLKKRYYDEIGRPRLVSTIFSYYMANNVKKNIAKKRDPVVSDPEPRWSYYNTFDERVWVRKGRDAKVPVPYRNPQLPARFLSKFMKAKG